jgi:hypothetical protein
MERVSDGKIWWQKKGGGSFMFNGQLIRPSMKFKATASEIPQAFRDLIIPLEEVTEVEVTKVVPVKVTYTIQPRGKSKSLFDVVSVQGKVVNEKALSKEVAENLVKDLMA